MTSALSGSEAKIINPWRRGFAVHLDKNLRIIMPTNETKWILWDNLLPERQRYDQWLLSYKLASYLKKEEICVSHRNHFTLEAPPLFSQMCLVHACRCLWKRIYSLRTRGISSIRKEHMVKS